MYKTKVTVPLVIRTPMGAGRGYGPTHSQNLEKHFLGYTGFKCCGSIHFSQSRNVVKNATLEDNGPVLFIENKILYAKELVESDNLLDIHYFGNDLYPTARIKNYKGSSLPDVTIFTYGG